MLPTRLSPVTVDNQYIVSQTAAFSTICCPCPFYFVIGQCEKRHHSGDAADGMMFIQGRKIGRYWLPAGRRAGQRAAAAAGFKNAGGNLKLSRTPREILQISLNMLRSDPNRAFPSPVTAVLLRDYSAQRVAGDKPIPVRDRH